MKKLLFFILFNYNLYAEDFKELLFNGNCTTCHFINKAVSAPSIVSIQKVYKKAFPKKEDFIKYMSTWVEHPNKEGSLMLYNIEKYELMPELGFEKEVLYDITEYIYNLKITI